MPQPYPKEFRDYVDEVSMKYLVRGSGDVRLTGKGRDVVLTPDSERRYLFDRDFSWQSRTPINR